MHRYRDAIRVMAETDDADETENQALATRPVAGYGVILYPHRPTLDEAEAVQSVLRRVATF